MEVILLGIAKGKNICNIAKEGGSKSTICRELKRNHISGF